MNYLDLANRARLQGDHVMADLWLALYVASLGGEKPRSVV